MTEVPDCRASSCRLQRWPQDPTWTAARLNRGPQHWPIGSGRSSAGTCAGRISIWQIAPHRWRCRLDIYSTCWPGTGNGLARSFWMNVWQPLRNRSPIPKIGICRFQPSLMLRVSRICPISGGLFAPDMANHRANGDGNPLSQTNEAPRNRRS